MVGKKSHNNKERKAMPYRLKRSYCKGSFPEEPSPFHLEELNSIRTWILQIVSYK